MIAFAETCHVTDATLAELRWFSEQSQLQPVRPLRQFAEDELRIPDGPHGGKRFRVHRQPEVGVWFSLVDQGVTTRCWNRFAATGPQQSGKTFSKWLCPMLWALFEWQENAIVFGPTEDILADKWKMDIRPAILASNYAELMPQSGDGSRAGGQPNLIRFQTGVCLKFMSGGGSDKKRSGFTSRWVFGTEIDGMDESGSHSREASKVDQIEGRTRAFDENKLVFLECTVSIPTGRIWQEYTNGTQTRLALPCPHCSEFVTPERDDFRGWQEAETEHEAEASAAFHCPQCSTAWTDAQRTEANDNAICVHRGQSVDADGTVTGDPPATRTLGFRYGAVNNLFVSSPSIANQEWKAPRSGDPDNADKALKQWVWVEPWEPDMDDITNLEVTSLMSRLGAYPRGHVPAHTEVIMVGADLRKTQLHWVATAWINRGECYGGQVIDYGWLPVESDIKDLRSAVSDAFAELNQDFLNGWIDEDGSMLTPSLCLGDSGWESDIVYAALKPLDLWMPSKGFGHGQLAGKKYTKPTKPNRYRPVIGDAWNISLLKGHRVVEMSADAWKTRAIGQLLGEVDKPSAVTLFHSDDPYCHRTFSRHLTAEQETFEFSAKAGGIRKWITLSKHNHFLDAYYMTRVALEVWLRQKNRKQQKSQREAVLTKRNPPVSQDADGDKKRKRKEPFVRRMNRR